MLRSRILTAAVVGPPVIVAALAGGIWSVGALVLLFGISLIEYQQLLARRGYKIPGGFLILANLLLSLDFAYFDGRYQTPLIVTGLLISLVWPLIAVRHEADQVFHTIAFTGVGLVYLAWSGAHFIGIRALQSGAFWVITALLIVWSADIGAFVGGKLLGKHLLLHQVSPKKTWEGYIAGVISALIAGVLLTFAGQQLDGGVSIQLVTIMPLALLIGLLSPTGDLLFSAVKRYAGAKDSGTILPGHGGLLDRIDSIFISGLLTYYYVSFVIFGTL